jgi:hypothetical protein
MAGTIAFKGGGCPISDFGFRPSFGLRISGFGFGIYRACAYEAINSPKQARRAG